MNLREELIKVRKGGIPNAVVMKNFLISCGFKKDAHLGKNPSDFTDTMILEWYLGQGITIVDKCAWFAMNSWLNCIEKYVPEDYEVKEELTLPEELFTL